MSPCDFKTRQQIAELYPIPYSTLKKFSMRGVSGGPPVIRIGTAVYYHVPSFEEWLKSFLALPNNEARRPDPPKSKSARRGRPTKSEVVERRRVAQMEAALTDIRATGSTIPETTVLGSRQVKHHG